jgi:hypothetical protein
MPNPASLWTISSPIGGTTCTTNYALGTASGNTVVGLLNPPGAAQPAYVQRVVLTIVTGTMVTGGFVWGVSPATQAVSITSTGMVARNNLTFLNLNTHVAKAFAGDTTNSVLAGSTANTVALLRPFGGGIAGATSAGQPMTFEEVVNGEIAVNPGCFAGLFPAVAGTALIVLAGLTWNEGSP